MYAACDPNPNPPYPARTCDDAAVISGIQASVWFDVLSMSLGGTAYSQSMANAVAQAWADGVVIVAAAGNRWSDDTSPSHFYPAEYTNVVGVSGVRDDRTFASSSPCLDPHDPSRSAASNYGSCVDIAAPFWALSTVKNDGYANETQGWCGTSMATPHVAGAAALLRQQHPTWTNQQIVNQLLSTASPDCGGSYCGQGILDAAYAVGIAPAVPLSASISGPTTIKIAGGYNWACGGSGGAGGYSYEWMRSDAGGPFFVVGSSASPTNGVRRTSGSPANAAGRWS